jgi:hypothetical protein
MAESRSIIDTFAYSGAPSTIFQWSSTLRMQGSGGTALAYQTISGFPTGPDVLITSAVLEWRTRYSWTACTLIAQRVTSSKAYSTLKYTSLPTSTSTGQVSTVLGALGNGALVQQDITAFVDAWAKGTVPNYGLRFYAGATAVRLFHAAQSTTGIYRPKLVYTAYRTPTVPTVTGPTHGQQVSVARPKLTWTPSTDPLRLQASYQVQMNATDSWGAPTYDSTEVASTAGEHLVTFDILNTETWFWRVRVKNGGGQWSDWSAGQEFGRTNKPTFSITQPTGGTWTDSTPPTQWSALSAGTQTQYRVTHSVGGVVKVDSGVLPGADLDWTSVLAIPGFAGGPVTTTVAVRDDVDRAATPSDSPWITDSETWTYTPGATLPATTISVSQHATLPVPVVAFTRATDPDRWDVQRKVDAGDWVSVGIFEGPDLFVSGTDYSYTDLTAPPHHLLEYRVVAGVNGIDSDTNPTDTITITADHIWLLDPEDDTFWCALADREGSGLAYTEDSEVAFIKGADRAQVTFDAFRGFSGGVAGGVYGTATSKHLGRTAQEMRDAIIVHVKTYPTRILRLVQSDYNIPVIVLGATPTLRPEAELSYGISFNVEQQGELPWDA